MNEKTAAYISDRRRTLEAVLNIIQGKVKKPISLEPDTIVFGTGVGLDSLDIIDIQIELEDRYGKDLFHPGKAEDFYDQFRTANKMTDHILRYQASRPGGQGA